MRVTGTLVASISSPVFRIKQTWDKFEGDRSGEIGAFTGVL